MAKDQTGRDVFRHRTEVLRRPLPDRLERLPAAGAGRSMGSDQLARAMVDGDEDIGAALAGRECMGNVGPEGVLAYLSSSVSS
jgi:hypothetical protein